MDETTNVTGGAVSGAENATDNGNTQEQLDRASAETTPKTYTAQELQAETDRRVTEALKTANAKAQADFQQKIDEAKAQTDNGAYETSTYIEKLGREMTSADIPPEVDALWRGIEQKNGVVEVGNDTKTAYFGVAWRILKPDKSYRYVRYYKGSYSFASNVGGKTKSSSGAPD